MLSRIFRLTSARVRLLLQSRKVDTHKIPSMILESQPCTANPNQPEAEDPNEYENHQTRLQAGTNGSLMVSIE
jgi:hypothetical protein